MLHKLGDLTVVSLAAAICATLLVYGIGDTYPIIAVIVGLLLGLVFPIYAAGSAVSPTGRIRLWSIAVGIAVTISTTILVGFVINQTTDGFQTSTWVLFLGGLTIVSALIAIIRRLFSQGGHDAPIVFRVPVRLVLSLAVTFILVIVGFSVSQYSIDHPPRAGFTQLWILPADKNDHHKISLGIRSYELNVTSYRLELTLDGKSLQEWPDIVLSPTETWETQVEAPLVFGNAGKIEARLYPLDNSDTRIWHTTWTILPY